MNRLERLSDHFGPALAAQKNTLSVVDNRTGKSYELPITDGAINATDLAKIKSPAGAVTRSFDPAYMNTVNCISRVSFINGEKGILEYRGIPIEQLAEQSTFLETAFLVIYGELPNNKQMKTFNRKVMKNSNYHHGLEKFITSFRHDAHPMGMMSTLIAAMSSFYPESNPAYVGANIYKSKQERNKHIYRIIGCAPAIAAACYRHRVGKPIIAPNESLGYVENFLYMMDAESNDSDYRPHPALVRALDILFILHAEHELNCSTAAIRHMASSQSDVYTSVAGAVTALYGPRHGGANEAVLRMLEEIGDVKNIPAFIEDVKNKKRVLMGFGHRVYKNYDPRATIVKKISDEVFAIVGREPLVDIAMELERIALTDEYFITKKLYPNVDFYSGVIYKALGIPTEMFTILFTLPRLSGWLAHWYEFLDDPHNKIVRPRQIYKGYTKRNFEPMNTREQKVKEDLDYVIDSRDVRREVSLEHDRKVRRV
jgi:citrate synthase